MILLILRLNMSDCMSTLLVKNSWHKIQIMPSPFIDLYNGIQCHQSDYCKGNETNNGFDIDTAY